jgi:hypothetical protein
MILENLMATMALEMARQLMLGLFARGSDPIAPSPAIQLRYERGLFWSRSPINPTAALATAHQVVGIEERCALSGDQGLW